MPPTLLVVEDDPLLLIDSRFVLENAGFAIVEAESAEQARDLLDAGLCVSGVVSDVRTPGAIDGVQLAEHVRQHLPDVCVVLTTGAPEGVTAPAGVTVIAKPYRPQQLTRAIASAA